MSEDGFAALVERVGAFHITDRAMKSAQTSAQAAVARGTVTPEFRRNYLAAVKQYFAGFEREARAHLRDVDKRLEALHQVQFNLSAERDVAVKRIEATTAVLDAARVVAEAPA
jgi:DNA-binding transcriptional regulator GbsR (MarR family)